MLLTTPQTLPKQIFGANLHTALHALWFSPATQSTTSPPEHIRARWFGIGLSPAQKSAFDDQCRSVSAQALSYLSPAQYPVPPFESRANDRKLACSIAAPLRRVVHDASTSSLSKSDVARSLMLLLDQMPRNIFRDDEGQRNVYTHYDRLARALLDCMTSPSEADVEHPVFGLDNEPKRNPMFRQWFYMPLMHSEDLADHDLYDAKVAEIKDLCGQDEDAKEYAGILQYVETMHRDLLEKYGRYPHRNRPLGRESTAAEKEYIEGGGETFGTSSSAKKDEE